MENDLAPLRIIAFLFSFVLIVMPKDYCRGAWSWDVGTWTGAVRT